MEHSKGKLLFDGPSANELKNARSADVNPILQERMHQHLSLLRQEVSKDYPASLKQALSQRVIAIHRKKLSLLINEDIHSEEA
ncbi:hypothetical protein [Sutcliffiella deserti]|uniref:hypothetical protein n=1 Tax=Sutcliffiella deserti TaxID=2875501 RepID=UPI001CBB19ED|nr:hypothetical protein [Sutcliffiella deserti]